MVEYRLELDLQQTSPFFLQSMLENYSAQIL